MAYFNKKIATLTTAICFISTISHASSLSESLKPRVWVSATTGNATLGEADAMLPLWKDNHHLFYGDLTAKYGDDNAYLGSVGIGGRKVIRNAVILGGYVFGDYNKTPAANYFTVLNPGIEFMTLQWDGHLNGYFPVGQKSKLMGAYTGAEVGMPSTNFFSGHSEYIPLYDLLEDVGPGVDAEIGRTLGSSLHHARVFGGSYYFTPKYTKSIQGIEAGVTIPLNNKWAALEARDSYDNLHHNTFMLTFSITFGGLDKSNESDIQNRMLDRIQRHLGSQSMGDGIPSQKSIVNTGRARSIKNNIWFFNSAGNVTDVQGISNCTFEHPCTGLAQTQIDAINTVSPQALFYLNSGTYNNPAVGSAYRFYNGQSVFGRTNNFSLAATNNDRPIVNDTLILNGNNTVDSLRINGNSSEQFDTGGVISSFQTGILINTGATGNVTITNSDINVNSGPNNVAGIVSLSNSNALVVNLNNSSVAVSTQDTLATGAISVAVGNLHQGVFNIDNTAISVVATDTANNNNITIAVANNENGTINLSNSTITSTSTNGNLLAGIINNSTVGLGIVNILKTTISVTSNNNNLVSAIFNQANNVAGNSGNVNISQSTLNSISNNNGGGNGVGIFNSGNGTVAIDASIINSTGDSGSINGILNVGPTSIVNFSNDVISINTSGTATGTPTVNAAGTLNDNGGNQCFVNGVATPC